MSTSCDPLSSGKYNGTVFRDVRKAFDLVDNNILILASFSRKFLYYYLIAIYIYESVINYYINVMLFDSRKHIFIIMERKYRHRGRVVKVTESTISTRNDPVVSIWKVSMLSSYPQEHIPPARNTKTGQNIVGFFQPR